MEDRFSLGNKKRFFGLYYGQEVGCDSFSNEPSLVDKDFMHYADHKENYSHLQLKPLSMITDEHLRQIGFRFPNGIEGIKIYFMPLSNEQHWIGKKHGMIQDVGYLHLGQFGFLRSNGYALPFTMPQGETITVDEMVEQGWVKLDEVK